MLGSAQPCLAPNPILGMGNLCSAGGTCLPKPQPNISPVLMAEEQHLPPPAGWLQWVPVSISPCLLSVQAGSLAWAAFCASRLAVGLSGSLWYQTSPSVQSNLPALQDALPATTFQEVDVAAASSQDIRGPSWQPSLKCCMLLTHACQSGSHLFPNI